MAVSKIWPVKGNLGGVLEYAKNKKKTDASLLSEEQYQALEDVLEYAANEEKTEQRFYVEGINCNPSTARQQFITVKKQFGKEDGIQAWHGYLSFDQGEVTPQMAQKIGMEFANRVWGEKYQVIVTTHLNTRHLHCHFVVNSVSFKDGIRCHEGTNWFRISKIADEICREHGLSVVENPKRNHQPEYFTMKERAGIPTRMSMIREAVDRALASSRSLGEFCDYLEDMGYLYNLSRNRKYWTVTAPGWERPMRLYRLGEDYSNERIVERIRENRNNPLRVVAYIPPVYPQQYFLPTRADLLLRKSRLYRKYLYYCYQLGIFPKHRHLSPLQVVTEIRDDLTHAERISEETRLLCREKIETTEDLIAYQDKISQDKAALEEARKLVRNQMKRKGTMPEEREELQKKLDSYGSEIKSLRKEIDLCDDIIRRSDEIDRRIEQLQESQKENTRGREGARHERER